MAKKILIVDDEIENQTHPTVRLLQRAGFVVHVARTIHLAQLEIGSNDYDVIICDGSVHQPGDGMRLAKNLHQAGLPVILCSGEIWPEASEIPQVTKPFKFDDLRDKVIEVMNKPR